MPSPRASPALRPTSPLSPRFDSGPRYESLQPPSPRNLHPRSAAAGSQLRHNANSLRLPALPRFHPANFPSSSSPSSQSSTPAHTPTTSTGNQPPLQPPVSPKAQQKIYSEAQKQLYLYHREVLAAQAGRPSSSRYEKPLSPRLAPLGSPGPVTPLELEGHEGYLLAGAHAATKELAAQSTELVEKLIDEEVRRNTELNRSLQSSAFSNGQ